MRSQSETLANLENQFPHLTVRKEGMDRSFRSPAGREVFRLEEGGKIRLPVPRQLLEDLFDGLPFPVDSIGTESVIRIAEVPEQDLIFNLIEAIVEQGGDESSIIESTGPKAAILPGSEAARKKSGFPSWKIITRVLITGLAILTAAFLVLSWTLAQRGVDQDRQRSIETLLRR